MKKIFGTRLACLLLCLCLLVPMLTACKTPNKDELSWEFTQENAITLNATVDKSGDNAVITVSHTDGIFSSVKKEQIKLIAYQKVATAASDTSKNWVSRELSDFSATLDSPNQITLTLPKNDSDVGYMAVVHSSAITSKKFGEAFATTDKFSDAASSAGATLTGEFAMGDKNPTIVLKLENTSVTDSFNKEQITLTDLFEKLEIVDATVSGDVITITTSGEIPYRLPFLAGVKLDASATKAATEIGADTNVICRSAYIDQKSFAIDGDAISFKAVLVSDTTTLAAGDTITENGMTFTVSAVSADKKEITFKATVEATSLDAKIKEIDGKTLTIPADKTGSKNALSMIVYANEARINAYIDYIEKTDAANTYKVTVSLSLSNGTWVGDPIAADLVFGGDLEGATVTKLEKSGNSFEVTLNLTKEGVNLDERSLLATLTVASAKINNAWGTPIAKNSEQLTYVASTGRDNADEELIAFVNQCKGDFSTLAEIGATIAKINPTDIKGVADSVSKILQLAGVIDKAETTSLSTLKAQIAEVQRSIEELDKKMDKIGSTISSGVADALTEIYRNTYLTASGNWNDFISNYVVPLQDKLTDFSVAYNEYMLNYITGNPNTSGAIDIYLDSKGHVTAPHPLNPAYSIDGTPLRSSDKYIIDAPLDSVVEKLMQNKGRLYYGYMADIEYSFNNVISATTGLSDPYEVGKLEYMLALQMNAAMYALNKVGMTEILAAYTNFCRALSGQGSTLAMKPLDSYMAMVSSYYNFYSEAKGDINTTVAWISGMLVRTTGLAMLAYEFTPAAPDNIISESFIGAANRIGEAAKEKSNRYSFIAHKDLHYTVISQDHIQIRTTGDIQIWTQGSRELDFTGGTFKLKSGSYADSNQILAMMGRYETLKNLGETSANSFEDYLISLGIIHRSYVYNESTGKHLNPKFLVSDLSHETVPKNNSLTFEVCWVGWSTWVKEGTKVKIGSNGKYSKSCFGDSEMRKGTLLSLNGSIEHDTIIKAYAHYQEDHLYWKNRECWDAGYTLSYPVILFLFE